MAPKKVPDAATDASAAPGGRVEAPKVCDAGEVFNQIQFPSPIYAAVWVDDKHVVVGGGGGARFGYANTLTLLRIDAASEQPEKLWTAVSSVDFNDGIVWEAAGAIPAPASLEAPRDSRVVCVSHVDSFSVVLYDPTGPKLTHVCRVDIENDKENPDKKPIAALGRTAFVVQDDKSIVMFDLEQLCAAAKRLQAKHKASTEAPHFPLLKASEVASSETRSWRVGCISGVFGERVSGIDVKEVDADNVVLAATCQDKTLRFFHLTRRSTSSSNNKKGGAGGDDTGSDAEDGAGAAHSAPSRWEVAAKLDLDGGALKLPLPLLKSSLRFVRLVQPSAASSGATAAGAAQFQALVVSYSARTGFTYVVNGKVTVKTGAAIPEANRLAFALLDELPARGIIHDAVTAMSPGGSTPASFLVSTTEGAVGEIECVFEEGARSAARLLRQRVGLHKEPISAVAARVQGGGTTVVVTTDIAQRVMLTAEVAPGAAKAPLVGKMKLFTPTRKSGSKRLTKLIFMLLALLVVVAGAWLAYSPS